MAKVITFGEIMLRLAPDGYLRFVQVDHLEALLGGGEANVSVSLANYGVDSVFVTKLPKHEIGQLAINSLRRFGVDTSKIVRGGDRIGVYYCEKGASQRPSKVIYDRAGSSIATASPSDFDWDEIFDGADWFHFTGITPALNPSVAAITLEACKAAKAKGLTVSCDLNYRKKLWTRDEARATMTKLMDYVDVCISNEEDAHDVFGIDAENTDIDSGKLNHEGYKSVARQLAEKFGFKKVAITLRSSISPYAHRRPRRRRRQFRRRSDLRAPVGLLHAGRDRIRGRGVVSEALDPGRLQYGDRGRSQSARRWIRQRQSTKIIRTTLNE